MAITWVRDANIVAELLIYSMVVGCLTKGT